MPATYSHRHTYEQITGRGRNTWKKPEPPPKPKTRQYFILGMEVDYNTYREYSYEKKWTIDGDVLKGFTVTLWSLEHYATEEHAKDYPIEAANARKILDQIRAEITSKGENTVKNPETAADYISALNDIYLESRSAYDTLHKKEEAAKVKMDQAYDDMRDPACSNRQMAEALYTVAKGEHQLAEEERRNEYSKLMKAHQVKVDELRTKFADHLGDRYAASGCCGGVRGDRAVWGSAGAERNRPCVGDRRREPARSGRVGGRPPHGQACRRCGEARPEHPGRESRGVAGSCDRRR